MKTDISDTIDKFPSPSPRDPESNFYKYIEAHEEEFDDLDQDIIDILAQRQVDNATGEDLDRIGRMFGELGRRAGRGDDSYRQYLQSLVESFNGRGTVPGIKFAIAAGLDMSVDNITVSEDFTELEYDIVFSDDDWVAHAGSIVEEMADLADASGTRLNQTKYEIPEDEATASDSVSVTEGQQASDTMNTSDTAGTGNTSSATDGMNSSDTVNTTTGSAGSGTWDSDDWDFTEWS